MVSYKRFLWKHDWMRFSVAFWHTFHGTGGDPFGAPAKHWPWEDGTNSVAMAKRRSKIDRFLSNFVYLVLISLIMEI
jgi:xylose isomerase